MPHFNPRSPHGERRTTASLNDASDVFQSTLPARGATYFCREGLTPTTFQSTLPARGATSSSLWTGLRLENNFNPRSPHGERRLAEQIHCEVRYFNPRSPHGERPCSDTRSHLQNTFQSTLPARGATLSRSFTQRTKDFNPRSPHGERLECADDARRVEPFQSTLPARGATYL